MSLEFLPLVKADGLKNNKEKTTNHTLWHYEETVKEASPDIHDSFHYSIVSLQLRMHLLLFAIFWRSSTTFCVSLFCKKLPLSVPNVNAFRVHPLSSITSNRLLAFYNWPSLQSPLIIMLYVIEFGTKP